MTIDTALNIGIVAALVGLAIILIRIAVDTVRERIAHGKGDAWEMGFAAGIDHAIAVYDAAVAREIPAEVQAWAEYLHKCGGGDGFGTTRGWCTRGEIGMMFPDADADTMVSDLTVLGVRVRA